MMWFTADTHFGHAAIIKHSARPFASVEEMDEALIGNWNSLVKPTDTVWHLGDFSFRNPAQYFERLNGTINLLWGNHDDSRVKQLTDLVRARGGRTGHVHYLRENGLRVWMSHYAHRVWRNSHNGSFHLHGHSHGDLPPHGRSLDVGVDAQGYHPVTLAYIVGILVDHASTNHHPDQPEVTFNGRDD
jgi:calcineurin-like phosphoesterase family protein